MASVDPILKAVRDVEETDAKLLLRVIAMLPRIHETSSSVEIHWDRRHGWIMNELHRRRIEVL